MKFLAAAASAALLMGAAQASAAVISIDTFDVTNQKVEDEPAAAPQSSEVAAPEAIGGWREMFVETDASGLDGATSLVVAPDPLNPSDGILSFNNDDGVTGRGRVTYDGLGNAGLGGLDLFDGPDGGFLFDVVRVDAELWVEISALDSFGESTIFAGSVIEGGTPFAPFAAFSNGAFNWNSVESLSFFAQSGPNSDVISLDGSISSISVNTGVIPLPATGLLLLGGLGGLSVLGRRRKRG